MGFQDIKDEIRWKMHFKSNINKVYAALTTDQGRASYWAEETVETDDSVEFTILNYPKYRSKVLQKTPPNDFVLEYFGTWVHFSLVETCDGGTDLNLRVRLFDESAKHEMTAGWVSVLMAMKAAVDFGIDLRNHSTERSWQYGYVDN